MQFDSKIRIPLGLEHNKFSIYQDPLFSAGLPKNTTIVTSLLEPCIKRELTSIIKAKGLKTIDKYSKDNFMFAYTDGSSDETFLNGGSKVFMATSSDANYQRVIGAGAIASCFTCELRVIIEALNRYEILPILEQAKRLVIFCDLKAALQAILNGGSGITEEICSHPFRIQELDKICFLQWLPAHDDITGKGNTDELTKEARNLNKDNFVNVTFSDANAVLNSKLRDKSIHAKHQIFNISGDRLITKTIIRIRIGHYIGIMFDGNGRTYRNSDNCLDTELIPAPIFYCPAILAALQEIGALFSSTNIYVDNIAQIAKTVIWEHGTI